MNNDITLTDTAEAVLSKRYYLEGEDWAELCSRVAMAIGAAGTDNHGYYGRFFDMLYRQDFLPNSPCLMNAGTELGQLCACFVLPIEDSLAGIFDSIKHGALVNKTGGGTGYSFSRLRPKNSTVCSTSGVASGPISFAKVFDAATDVVKQGGRRRGANMGVLRVDHPDIMEFINVKRTPGVLTNFNLSVAVTDEFMRAVENDSVFFLQDPETKRTHGHALKARAIFDAIIDAAWDNGEPGILFIDAANRANPTPWLGEFEATNPCGEQWLLPYEACNLGSINLGKFVETQEAVVVRSRMAETFGQPLYVGSAGAAINWDRLEEVTRLATRFLDRVVDASTYPIPEIAEATKFSRKIGLGIMGLHDMLIKLGIPYDSKEGRELAAKVMQFIRDAAHRESVEIANEDGNCPAFAELEVINKGIDKEKRRNVNVKRRNAALTSIQPTGTVSMIANCSSGCEPYFAVVTRKDVMDGQSFFMVNPLFEEIGKRDGWYSEELLEEVAASGTVLGNTRIPPDAQRLFACAQDISVEDHIKMQAALQANGVDASISKTINMPASATKEDVKAAYMMGWKLGCKGLTVYRDGSREGQVLNVGKKEEKAAVWDGANWQMVSASGPVKRELPDTLNSKRFRLKDQDGQNIYIIICFDDSQAPVEVFAKFPFDNRIELQERSTMWATVCRLISLAFRFGVPAAEVVKQLDRSSGSMFDLPAQLSKLFKQYLSETAQTFETALCHECGIARLQYQEGCLLCPHCGYSKCG
jgi:ribonucleoside-diphosphate reductase alpha chain